MAFVWSTCFCFIPIASKRGWGRKEDTDIFLSDFLSLQKTYPPPKLPPYIIIHPTPNRVVLQTVCTRVGWAYRGNRWG